MIIRLHRVLMRGLLLFVQPWGWVLRPLHCRKLWESLLSDFVIAAMSSRIFNKFVKSPPLLLRTFDDQILFAFMIKREEASTHRSAKINAGTVFVTSGPDL